MTVKKTNQARVELNLTMPEVAMCLYIAIERYVSHDLTKHDLKSLFGMFQTFCLDNYSRNLLQACCEFIDRERTRDNLRRHVAEAFDAVFDLERCSRYLNDRDAIRDYEHLLELHEVRRNCDIHPRFAKVSGLALRRYNQFKDSRGVKTPIEQEDD